MTGDDTPTPAPVPPSLLDLPKAERNHPLFRRGYNLGYAHRVHEESLADLEKHGPRFLRQDDTSPPPRSYGVTDGGLLHLLKPGDRADRDLFALTDTEFTTDTPCCGRKITVQIPEEDQTWPAACCRCRVSYEVHLIQEEPDGYSDEPPPHIAVFIVDHLHMAVTQHRTGKWEQALQPAPHHWEHRSTHVSSQVH